MKVRPPGMGCVPLLREAPDSSLAISTRRQAVLSRRGTCWYLNLDLSLQSS